MRPLLLLLLTLPAQALPPMQTWSKEGLTLQVPKGWTVRTEAQPVPTVHIEARPGAKDSPSVMLVSMPLSQGPNTPGLFAQNLVSQLVVGAQVQAQQQMGTGHMMIVTGQINGLPAKLAVLTGSEPAKGVGTLAAFAAPTKNFDQLGGPQLLLAILGQAPAQAQAQVQPPSGAAKVRIPAKYRKSGAPVAHYLAAELERLTPAQIAGALRQSNQTDVLQYGLYSAFGSMLHFLACQADPTLVMPFNSVPSSCAQTNQQWRQTVQMSGGNTQQAFSYAFRQRDSLLIAWRCGNGTFDKGSCAAYRSGTRAYNTATNNTMNRIISHLSPNGCIEGDPGCVVP